MFNKILFIVFTVVFSQETPSLFEYEQSTQQAFYFFNSVSINDTQIESDDWVGAFYGDICVGSRQWDTDSCGGGICDVPVMGDDGSSLTNGYMTFGSIPTFKIYDSSEDIYYEALSNLDICEWANFGFCSLEELSYSGEIIIFGCTDNLACNYNPDATEDDNSCLYANENYDCYGNCIINIDCAGECGGNSVFDECGECGGNGIDPGECDCDGNILDDCEICGGNNELMDCNGECGGNTNCNINISLNPYEFDNLVLFTSLNIEQVSDSICINQNPSFFTVGNLDATIGDCILMDNQESVQIYITNQFYITEFNVSLSGLTLDSSTNGAQGGLIEYLDYNWDIVGNNIYGSLHDSSEFIVGLTSDCTDNLSCNLDIADINDQSICIYPSMYWLDIDGDGLGDPLFYYILCPDAVNSSYVSNANDLCPNDSMNDIDNDGFCSDQDDYPYCFDIGDGNDPYDCLGECNGNAFIDDCSNCVGGDTGLEENYVDLGCGCNNPAALEYWQDTDGDGLGSGLISLFCLNEIPENWVLLDSNSQDPYPDCYENFYDECGNCGGEGISEGLCDCSGALPGIYCIDTDDDGAGNSNPDTWITVCPDEYLDFGEILFNTEVGNYCTDENEDCSGIIDLCGVCEGNNQNQDCAEECFGNNVIDDNENCCNSDTVDDCNICGGNNESMDCSGECSGIAIVDCNSECGGSAVVDECGECGGNMFQDNFGLYPDGSCDCFGSIIDSCGECTLDPCSISAFFAPLINNDYKDYVEAPIYLSGYNNNLTGLEGIEFQFSYNSIYYILDDKNGVYLEDNFSEYYFEYNDYFLNDSLNQVDVIIYASDSPITNLDVNEKIMSLTFNLNDDNGDYSYIHNKSTELNFIDDFKINNSIIEKIDGLVEFKTIMCLDSVADNFCNNEDPNIPSIPEEECLYYNNLDDYIIIDGSCEYIIQVEIDSEGSILDDILLSNGDESIQLFIESGTVMLDNEDFEGQVSFSEFYNIDILPNPTADDDTPLILWGEVVSFEPYEIIFEDESGQVIVTIEFTPFGERDELEYDLYKLDNLNDTSWERVENQSCGERDCSGEIDSFGIFSVVIGGLGCIDAEACNFNESAVVDDGSCFYSEEFGEFCYDEDGDSLGYDHGYNYDQCIAEGILDDDDCYGIRYFCPNNISDNWVNNCLDPEPDCPNPDPETLLIDNCGICGGQNECFEYPNQFIDSWVLVEQNQYTNSNCYAVSEEDVLSYTGPFNANFINENGLYITDECLTYKIEIQYTEPCEWIDVSCHEIDNSCNINSSQELCEFNDSCRWYLESCIESNNNCINIDNEIDCIENSDYSNLAQFSCVTNEVYDNLFGGGWIYDEEVSEIFEWGVSTSQLCFNSFGINNYNCIDYVFANDDNEIRLQYIDNNMCFQETYQRASYLSVFNEVIPDNYKLYKNFPNPFNPVTNIRFDLPSPDYISLDIYNINGQHVESIVNGYFIQGSYEFKFNAQNLSSGIYFVTLSTNSLILTNKMVLLK